MIHEEERGLKKKEWREEALLAGLQHTGRIGNQKGFSEIGSDWGEMIGIEENPSAPSTPE